MDYNKPMKVNRRRRKGMLIPALVLILFAVLLSLAIAAIWQMTAEHDETPSVISSSLAQVSSAPMSSSSSASSSQAASSEPQTSSEAKAITPAVEGAVSEAERVKSAYFDDAVFVGDSITTGIQLYNVMSNTKVLAGTGINLGTLYTSSVVKLEDGSRITIIDGLKAAQYKKVYVMLGGNEIGGEDQATFVSRYTKVIDDIKALQPDALIYVQSILPVTKKNKYNMDNVRIDEFNAVLLKLCKEKNVLYLNVAECMKDETGALPDAASPADGMHFGPDYYNKWFEYLKTHTVAQ
ncbi:GDSL-type esterase/lipase family protein [Oscillospiraceae bacterium PP1C4]